ncbi:hypothetical protein ELI41_29650 (plasmid) [Rhizobium leguminosarum]|uniref:hypothetical protein n=1 Tax=Rhizobium leguminosarum TaxID=384 RepID=UPI00102FAD58|nr:hypothetical protein [Rhizobium leguminosarum]TAU80473.1 hypothetical protein ELI41_29650 [Rhizobium leguminosarum]
MTKNKDSRTDCGSQSVQFISLPADVAQLDFEWFGGNPARLWRARWTTNAELSLLPASVARHLPGCRMVTAVHNLPSSGLLFYEHGSVAATDKPESLGEIEAEALFEYFTGRARGSA